MVCYKHNVCVYQVHISPSCINAFYLCPLIIHIIRMCRVILMAFTFLLNNLFPDILLKLLSLSSCTGCSSPLRHNSCNMLCTKYISVQFFWFTLECSWNKLSTCYNKPTTVWPHTIWTLEHCYWTPSTLIAWTSDAFKPRNTSQPIFQRSPKAREQETWQTANDKDTNNSKIPDQERHLHRYARHKCNQRTRVDVPWPCGMESKMQHAGNPRDVTWTSSCSWW